MAGGSSATIGALRVVLSLNAGEYARGLRESAKKTEDFGFSVKKLSDQMEAASYEFNSGVMAAQRFASVVMNVISTTREFSSGMSAVATLVDTNTESMKSMSAAVLEIGRRVPVVHSDLTSGLYDLRSAGTSAADAMGRLEQSAKLGVAGLGTTKEAVDLVTSSINAFGLKGAEAADIYNVIFKTVQSGKTTIAGLAQGFGAVASTVSAAGISVKEYMAAIAALTVTGLPAAVAHTQIRAAIAGMTRETEESKKVLDAMNVKTFKELIDKSGGMVQAFTNISKVVGGNDAAIVKLFGSIEAYNAVLSLSGKQSEQFKDNLLKMNDGVDAMGEAFDKRKDTIDSAIKLMSNAFEEMKLTIGNALAPTIKEISQFVVGLVEAFKSLSPETQELIVKIGLLASVIIPAIAAIGFFINALSGVVGIVATVAGALGALLVVGGPLAMLITVTTLVTAAWTLFQDDIISIIYKVADAISTKVMEIIEWMRSLGTYVSEVFSKIWSGEFEGAMNRMSEGVTPGLKKIADGFADIALQTGLVSVTVETAAKKQFEYQGAIIDLNNKEAESVRNKNTAYREALAVFNETLTPLEKIIFKQMELHGLWTTGKLDAVSYGRAMAQASVFSSKNMDALASSVSSNLSTIFGDSKAVAIATALINTYQGITRAIATYPPPISTAMAAIQAAAGFAQVAKIRSQTSKGGGGGGGGGGEAASVAPAVPATGVTNTLMVQGISAGQMFSGDAMRGLAEQMLEYQRNGGTVILEKR
jgi:TP901 family phage tail tape measure protein